MMYYVCSTDHSMEQIFLLIKVKWKYFASTFTENCKHHDISSTMQFPFTHLAWLLLLCLLRSSGCQWMDLMRRSCERLEDNYSDLPASEWSCFSCAGLGWAGVYRPVHQLAGRRTPVVASDVNSSSDLIPATTTSPLQLSTTFRGTQCSEILAY